MLVRLVDALYRTFVGSRACGHAVRAIIVLKA
jgi:hypothetical protein